MTRERVQQIVNDLDTIKGQLTSMEHELFTTPKTDLNIVRAETYLISALFTLDMMRRWMIAVGKLDVLEVELA